jgi:hypothetical protein
MRNINQNNLTASEGDSILKGVKVLIDILVKTTGGKPWFGGKK